ncbi:hypothetical protein SKAU_G00263740 [Synaphobranchus kaupii]|uniref:G-protein coupled receptors family 1 profile domain-containing protein n=1 Tax=Synaphobranchus kaupii TaxID=118154 RepID=A0A9Q1EYV9_SYNKA|nr:hypothetical protein SKAU_G00263740 [Synaphobranchus kaupii]
MANITVIISNITLSKINKGVPAKAILSMTPCFFFLYINVVMLITLRSKAIFRETSRYILFTNMLFADSLNLALCMLMYIFAILRVYISGFVCLILVLAGGVISLISPISLAVMALERYIAICFPLRHAEITTCSRTAMAIAIVWALGSVQSLTNLIFLLISGPFVSTRSFCSTFLKHDLERYLSIKCVEVILGNDLAGGLVWKNVHPPLVVTPSPRWSREPGNVLANGRPKWAWSAKQKHLSGQSGALEKAAVAKPKGAPPTLLSDLLSVLFG